MRGLAFALVAGAVVTSCYYDSRWGEAKREQRRNAAREAPASIQATSDREHPPPTQRVARVRVLVTPAYASQVLDWKRQSDELLEDASRIFAPMLGVRFILESASPWEPKAKEDDLGVILDALRVQDPGADVDWVVGCIGNLPRATHSFHEAGMGSVLGKHLVVRAPSRLDEYDAVDKAFDQLKEDERARLRRELRRHRAAAVFLHEIGHTLGALHENNRRDLMNPQYDREMTEFASENVELMRVTLEHRGPEDAAVLRRELLAVLDRRAQSNGWVDGERDLMKSRLSPASANPPSSSAALASPPAASAAAAAPPPQVDLSALRQADREIYTRASEQMEGGDYEAAWRTGTPIFRAYPDSLVVQDLRCKIASARGLPFDLVRPECARLMELSTQAHPR